MSYIQQIDDPQSYSEVDFLDNPSIISDNPNQIWYSITDFRFFQNGINQKLDSIDKVRFEIKTNVLYIYIPKEFSQSTIQNIVEKIGCIDNQTEISDFIKTTTHIDQLNVNFMKEILKSKNYIYQSIVYNMFSILAV